MLSNGMIVALNSIGRPLTNHVSIITNTFKNEKIIYYALMHELYLCAYGTNR